MANSPSVPSPTPEQPCPCGSGRSFGQCCAPILSGREPAPDAERLMRARFTAHATHHFKFLHDTYRDTAGKPFTAEEGEPGIRWTRLVVHSHEPGNSPERAFVDFSAYGAENGEEKVLHEKAEFGKVDGTWLYLREARLGPAPYKSAAPKVGRNDPCPCGSGKKYKHCCLLKAG
ncbi:MAG TPA: YchJ family metal-binding protein [Opitutaceae bacterium]|nr:YchJ family metal-binding protein [Opitutaceae bacterium]